jgi:hypothetical protein
LLSVEVAMKPSPRCQANRRHVTTRVYSDRSTQMRSDTDGRKGNPGVASGILLKNYEIGYPVVNAFLSRPSDRADFLDSVRHAQDRGALAALLVPCLWDGYSGSDS